MPTFTGTPAPLYPAGHKLIDTELKTWFDELAAASGAFTAYTPAWASSGTAVSLGNGTITGKYSQVGKRVDFSIVLTIGSTTTFGTGSYTLSLPVTALDTNWCAEAHFFDANSAPNRMPGVAVPNTTSLLFAYFGPINTGAGTFVAGGQWALAVPSTPNMATGDKLIISGTYEAA